MVTFTCNACGESVKKPKVMKHYQTKCPDCTVLSCLDCGRDFYGDEYNEHNSCISEAEKYQGALYKGGGSGAGGAEGTKGKDKQAVWMESIRASTSKTGSPALKSLIQQCLAYKNVPRKRDKFLKFGRNSLKMKDTSKLLAVFDIFEKVHAELNPAPEPAKVNASASAADAKPEEAKKTKKKDKKDKKKDKEEAAEGGESPAPAAAAAAAAPAAALATKALPSLVDELKGKKLADKKDAPVPKVASGGIVKAKSKKKRLEEKLPKGKKGKKGMPKKGLLVKDLKKRQKEERKLRGKSEIAIKMRKKKERRRSKERKEERKRKASDDGGSAAAGAQGDAAPAKKARKDKEKKKEKKKEKNKEKSKEKKEKKEKKAAKKKEKKVKKESGSAKAAAKAE